MSSLVINPKRKFLTFSPQVTQYTILDEESKIQTKASPSNSKGKEFCPLLLPEKEKKEPQKETVVGEYYGSKIDEMQHSLIGDKEKRLMEFLEQEKVEWGDPAEKAFSYYNKKKLSIQKKNMSCDTNLNNIAVSNELNIEASPLMMRRKMKCNTMSPGVLRLKESFSADNIGSQSSDSKKISPTKFKLLNMELKN